MITAIDWEGSGVSAAQFGGMLGNAMSVPVVAGVIASALWASGLVDKKPKRGS